MQWADAHKVQNFLRQVRAPKRVTDGFAHAFNQAQQLGEVARLGDMQRGELPGQYGSESNPNTTPQDYTLDDTFRGANGQLSLQAGGPPPYSNPNSFSLFPFSTDNVTSIQVVPANLQRTILIVQNLDAAANLFINFDNAASSTSGMLLAPGAGIIFDFICPNNGINAIYSAAGQHFGVIVQSTRVV